MNILFLTQEYPPETGWGGVGTYTRTIAHALARVGHQVHVLASSVPPRASYNYDDDGVHVHRVRREKFEFPLLRRLWFNTLPWTKHQWEYIFSVRSALERLVRAYSIDCIESSEIWAEGLLYSFQRDVPIVVKLNGPLYLIRQVAQQTSNLDWKLVERTDQWWTARADRLLASSASLADIVARKYKIPRETIRVIPNPVDTERFQPSLNGQPPVPTILYTGRLEPRKGVSTLVEAIPKVLRSFPDARFVFVGADTNSYASSLLEQLQGAGVARHVVFKGHVAHHEITNYYQSSTVCVFPSTYEPFGIGCVEAMACAKPVVASRAGGLAEIVRDGEDGLLVPPQTPDALAAALNTILVNPTRARAWGENARRHVERNFSSQVIAPQMVQVYEETVARWRAR